MKKKLILLFMLFLSLGLYSQEVKIGATYTPGRLGFGGIIQTCDKLFIGYEHGKYVQYTAIYGYESIYIRKYSVTTKIASNENIDLLFGVGYNDFYKTYSLTRDINLSTTSKIALEFGAIYNFDVISSLLLVNIVKLEGKIGILINV